MLTDAELATLATDLESDRVERKETLTAGDAKEKVAQAVCAFSNDLPRQGRPGTILIGVDDRGRPTGLPITDQLLQTLSALRSDGNILPLPTLTVQKRTLDGVDVAVVEVEPAVDPPVRYRGVVWIRVGPRRAIASRDEERLLTEKRRYGNLSFDQRGMPGARLDHLDLDFFRRRILPAILAPDVLAANNRTIEEQLAAAHFLTPDGLPTVAALLLCGNDPQYWIPGAYLQFVRFDGDDVLAPIIDEQALRGTLVDQLRLLDDLLRLNIRTAIEVGDGLQEVRRPDYPLIALQQLGRNALMHRNYETSNAPVQLYWFADRVEIHNPGGLFGRTTPETFGRTGGNDYRNQTLASFFKALGFVQTFGLGIPLARRACADNQNPPPEFAFQPGTFGAIVRKRV